MLSPPDMLNVRLQFISNGPSGADYLLAKAKAMPATYYLLLNRNMQLPIAVVSNSGAFGIYSAFTKIPRILVVLNTRNTNSGIIINMYAPVLFSVADVKYMWTTSVATLRLFCDVEKTKNKNMMYLFTSITGLDG